MQEPYDQGLANQIGPAPCADVREGMGEASVRGSAGWVSSRESNTSETPTLWVMGEGNTVRNAHGEFRGRSRVVIDPRHVRTLVVPKARVSLRRMGTGRSLDWPSAQCRRSASGRPLRS